MTSSEEIPGGFKRTIKITKAKVLTFLSLLIVAVFVATGLYVINPEEVGIIQRFGKYHSTTEPGLNFKLPLGIDRLTKVKIKYVFKEEFGFRTVRAGVKTQYSTQDYSDESLMLTGDLNIADVEWIVQYRIDDPKKYLFNIRDMEETIRTVSEMSIRMIVGDRSIDEVIVLNRKEIADTAQLAMQKKLDEYNTGITIVTINLQNVNPPEQVRAAFNDVNSAKQEEERIVNEAWQAYNNKIPEASGKAKQIITQAEGYAINRVNTAQGDVQKFVKVWNEYRKAKDVTRKRLYLETLNEILPKMEKIYIMDESNKGILPLLNLQEGGK